MLGLMILILDGKTALSGGRSGIELCLKTVIPALFPFFVLSSVLLHCAAPSSSLEAAAASVFGLPQGGSFLLLPCFLGGYPVGARCVHQAYRDGLFKKEDAEKLLSFCNNAGPAFLFGMIGQVFSEPWMPWALWGIHLAGAMIAARCVPSANPVECYEKPSSKQQKDAISGSVSTMGLVCGWIVLFRILTAFLDRWFLWLLPQTARTAIIGILELSNGCCELDRITDIPARFILCSGMLAAGGLCVTAQTIAVTPGLSLHYYCIGKTIQVLVSLCLSFCIMYQTPFPLLLLVPLLFRKKRSGNQIPAGV